MQHKCIYHNLIYFENIITQYIPYIMTLHTTNLSSFSGKISQQKIVIKFSTSQLQINSQERTGQPSTQQIFLSDPFQFSLNLSTVYSDSFPLTSFLVQMNLSMICSDSSPDPCRFSLNLSTNYLDFFPTNVFSSSDKSSQRFILILLQTPTGSV